jgi:predicted ATPase/DNA-binding XRE family transcriptional regulator
MQDEISFGHWLRKQRRTLDLTRQAFANQVGCAEVTLRRIEAGTLRPSKELANILLEKLSIPEVQRPQWISFARGLTGIPTQTSLSSKKQKSNLSAPLTSFIGREKEQADVIRLLGKRRLVTLTGSGGVGKSRLSVKVGEQILENYADGVWFVEMASLSDPAQLAQTVTALFGIASQADIPHAELLVNFLRPKSLLLILDNCEHLVDGCAQFTDLLLKNSPGLKILASSREPISVVGEALYRVPSLGLPVLQQLPTLDHLREFEAIRLFEERAQLAQFDFSVTLENAASVAQICQRLDGIPLAIELAAAKAGILSIEQIAYQLDKSFNVLTDGSRTALPRHYTLRASMDWSWGLLTEPEQTLMRQLSVFAGGWTLDAAQAVCAGDVLELTNSLVKKSLIVVNQKAGRDTRYGFHEIVRQYAHEKFVETGEGENIRTRHMRYFTDLTKRAEPELTGPTQMEWLECLKDERDNVRAALRWADQTDLEAGLCLSRQFGFFGYIFDLREGHDWLSRFLEKTESKKFSHARAKALYVYGLILYNLHQLDAAYTVANECLELFRALGDQGGEVDGLLLLIWEDWLSGTERMALAQQALELAQELGDVHRQAEALWQVGYADQGKNRFKYWESAIELARSLGNVGWLASNLSTLALYLASNGDLETAQEYLNESDQLSRQFNLNPPPGDFHSAYGQIALIGGDFKKARASFEKSAETHLEFGNRHEYLWARAGLGFVALRQGNIDEANQIFSETARDFRKDKHTSGVVFALEGLAGSYVAMDKTDYAACLVGWTDATREKSGDSRPLLNQENINQIMATCMATMGEVAFFNAYGKGKTMSLDEAVAYALEG